MSAPSQVRENHGFNLGAWEHGWRAEPAFRTYLFLQDDCWLTREEWLAPFRVEFADVDRAQLDGEEDGFLAVHVKKGSDRILGATLVARHAGETISEVTAAMTAGVGLGELARTIHP